MEALSIKKRLQIYTNAGAIGFSVAFLLGDEIITGIPVILNLILGFYFAYYSNRIKFSFIAFVIGIITNIFSLIQFNYKETINWSCISQIISSAVRTGMLRHSFYFPFSFGNLHFI
jgi:uncharacterized membrane protein YjjP (DUF1212 family)